MAIQFVPNDPLAMGSLPAREQSPRPDPPAGQVGFAYPQPIAEQVYALGTPGFVFWQCREAALAALEVWAALTDPFPHWQTGAQQIPLIPDAGSGLNAAYDRKTLSFLSWQTPEKTTHCGASTDAVAHEVGHALLDALRPELWNSPYPETAAFHEAFADCIALLVGFFDADARRALLMGGSLRGPNFVASVAEEVADSIGRAEGAAHPQSAPRLAWNQLQWEIPINLPPLAPPAQLAAEAHSFSRVFSGCFYDTICNLFEESQPRDERALLRAAITAGRLLVAAAEQAPEMARFFQAVGRAMILADEAESGGANHRAIRDGFASHNIALGSAAMLAPSAGLSGKSAAKGDGVALSSPARRDLLSRIGAPAGSRLRLGTATVGVRNVGVAVHARGVALGRLDRRLRGAVATAAESILLGVSAGRALVLGHLPDPGTTVDEVSHFVATLLEHGRLALEPAAALAPLPGAGLLLPTHRLRARGGRRELSRIRFACGSRGARTAA